MTDKRGSLFGIAAEYVVNDDVRLEAGNHDEAVEHQERGDTELQEGLEFEGEQETGLTPVQQRARCLKTRHVRRPLD